MSKNFTDLKVLKLPRSEAEITGSLTLEYLESCRSEAIKSLNNRFELPGFRKGNVPDEILVKQLGDMSVLEEVAEVALGRAYGEIMDEAKKIKDLSPIGRPQVSITKLAPGVPLEFKIKVTLEPEFTLPDYKKIAKSIAVEESETEVTEKEITDVLEEIKKRDIKPNLKEGEVIEEKVKENLIEEKRLRATEKKRLKLVEELVKATDIEVPDVLVQSELEKMLGQFKDDVERMGMKFPEYLKELKKTEEEVKEEWKPQAIERTKAEMIVAKIAEAEKIEPTKEEIEHETNHILSHYSDADPLRVRIYVFTLIRNQKVLEYLEGLK